MISEGMGADLSSIDEERFGIRTARATMVILDTLPTIMDFCQDNNVVLLIARCAVSELRVAQKMERQGFQLMDTLVYYTFDLERRAIPSDAGEAVVRPLASGEEDEVKLVAAESFRSYYGHYHADEKLDRTQC